MDRLHPAAAGLPGRDKASDPLRLGDVVAGRVDPEPAGDNLCEPVYVPGDPEVLRIAVQHHPVRAGVGRRQFLHHPEGAVRAAVVGEDDLERRPCLRESTGHGFGDQAFLVVGLDREADKGTLGGRVRHPRRVT